MNQHQRVKREKLRWIWKMKLLIRCVQHSKQNITKLLMSVLVLYQAIERRGVEKMHHNILYIHYYNYL